MALIAVILIIRHFVSAANPDHIATLFALILIAASIWQTHSYITEGRYQPTLHGRLVTGFAKGFLKSDFPMLFWSSITIEFLAALSLVFITPLFFAPAFFFIMVGVYFMWTLILVKHDGAFFMPYYSYKRKEAATLYTGSTKNKLFHTLFLIGSLFSTLLFFGLGFFLLLNS